MKKVKNLVKYALFTLEPIEYPKDEQLYMKETYNKATNECNCYRFSNLDDKIVLDGNTLVYTDFII